MQKGIGNTQSASGQLSFDKSPSNTEEEQSICSELWALYERGQILLPYDIAQRIVKIAIGEDEEK